VSISSKSIGIGVRLNKSDLTSTKIHRRFIAFHSSSVFSTQNISHGSLLQVKNLGVSLRNVTVPNLTLMLRSCSVSSRCMQD